MLHELVRLRHLRGPVRVVHAREHDAVPAPLQAQVFVPQADRAGRLERREERVGLARGPVVVAAHEVHRRYGGKLTHERLELRQLPLRLALVQEIAREGYELRLLRPDLFDEPGVALAEARAVQVAQLHYTEAVKALGQALEAQLQPRDPEPVLRQQHARAQKRQDYERGEGEGAPLSHCASWSRM